MGRSPISGMSNGHGIWYFKLLYTGLQK